MKTKKKSLIKTLNKTNKILQTFLKKTKTNYEKMLIDLRSTWHDYLAK